MKIIFLLLSIVMFLSTEISPQSHLVYFSAGYNVPTTTAVISSSQSGGLTQQTISTYSEGIVYQGGYQFVATENFLLDVNFNYLPGYKDEKYYANSEGVYWSYTNSNFSVSPTINIKFNVGNISPYTKFGISVNFIHLEMNQESGGTFSNLNSNYSYKGRFTLGLVGGIGINLLFDKTFILFLETQLNSFTYYPEELTITQTSSNGNKITDHYYFKENANGDDEIGARAFPFSSLGFMAGVRIVL
jgi:hypothetical protein